MYDEKCRNCVYMDLKDRDGVNSSKCYCSEKDDYRYPDENACSEFEEK